MLWRMDEAPTEVHTFLFTDIEGSTRLQKAYPDAAKRAIDRHDALVATAIVSHGGRVFKTVGDAFCCAFGVPAKAVSAAVDIQRALATEPWSALDAAFPPLRVRAALHTGPAEPRGTDFAAGFTLACVSRLLGAASGGQVFVSGSTRALVADQLPGDVSLRDLGEHPLPDFQLHIFQALADGVPDVTAPPRLPKSGPVVVRGDIARSAKTPAELVGQIVAAAQAPDGRVELSPHDVRQILHWRPANLTEYRAARLAEWSQERYHLDQRFVALTLMVDQGPEMEGVRWRADPRRFDDLRDVLDEVVDPAVVVLGPPGSGKTTLLRRLELDLALDGLRGKHDGVTFWVPLNSCHGPDREGPPPPPATWLAERWRERYPALPPLADLVQEGRLILLLDALNEMPQRDEADYRERVREWREYLTEVVGSRPGNRVVFTCRTLDYSALLSSPELPVPQVMVEPLSDDQIRDFLKAYNLVLANAIWDEVRETPQLELLRSPYFLELVLHLAEADEGRVPNGRVALFTGFVRRALLREVERDQPLFGPGIVLSERDLRRLSLIREWPVVHELPEDGELFRGLAGLAYGMQAIGLAGEPSQLRAGWDEALRLIGGERAEAVLRAGMALGILDEDVATEEVLFRHQLLQEYFAARYVARRPRLRLARSEWRADRIEPSLETVLASLARSDPLPPLPSSGWEETMRLAVGMARDSDAFVSALAEQNLPLAGQCAVLTEAKVSEPAKERLRWALVKRSRDPDADLRARIAAGLALGELGDPRFERHEGPYGPYLLPPMVDIPGGTYIMGSDEGIYEEEAPQHTVEIAPFRLAMFPVTNAEYALFMQAGGYDDEQWWDTEDAKRWRRGEGTAEGSRWNFRVLRRQLLADPAELDRLYEHKLLLPEDYTAWQQRLMMTDTEFEANLASLFPDKRSLGPAQWRHPSFSNPLQPVVGITWFEARAYCRWLTTQTGCAFRLPTEAEWEAAARGSLGLRFAYGNEFDGRKGNTTESHLWRTSPVGIFPAGNTLTGLCDMTGNVFEWTSTCFIGATADGGRDYPYRPDDGREMAEKAADIERISRGGAWYRGHLDARNSCRYINRPDVRFDVIGLRLAGNPRPGSVPDSH